MTLEEEFKQKLWMKIKQTLLLWEVEHGVELTAELYHAAEDLSSYGYGKIDSSCFMLL